MRRPLAPRASSARLAPLLVLAAIAAAPGAASCSFRLVKRPPALEDWPPAGSPPVNIERCTESYMPPVTDTVVAVALATLVVVERNAGTTWTPFLLGGLAVPIGVSAGYGYGAVHECRRYRGLFTGQP
jgi:hypothetical protein